MHDHLKLLNYDEKRHVCTFLPIKDQLTIREASRHAISCVEPLTYKLLTHVVEGLEDQAEAILRLRPGLALEYGTLQDHAGRLFKGATPLQIAVCNLDWHMWEMLRRYLPQEALEEQLEELVVNNELMTAHEEVVDSWYELIGAYEVYFDVTRTSGISIREFEERTDYAWTTIVGTRQRCLPAHVLQVFCAPAITSDTEQTFTRYAYPRADILHRTGELDFAALGREYALVRGNGKPRRARGYSLSANAARYTDQQAISLLLKTRFKQCKELLAHPGEIAVEETKPKQETFKPC
jgi:hypothetical protein